MAIKDETLAIAIPSALKTDHPDSALVVQGIAIALAACENSSAMTAKGRMKDVHDALQSVYVPIYTAHIAKEDEDWSALKSRAEAFDKSEGDILTAKYRDLWEEKEKTYREYRREKSSSERKTLVMAMDEIRDAITATEARLIELGIDPQSIELREIRDSIPPPAATE